MKSFTRSQPNIQALRSDKRFDALVKKQESEHQHIIASHHEEMQTLRDNLSLSIQRFTSLFESHEKELNEFRVSAWGNIGTLIERLKVNETTISDQKKTIEDLNKQLICFHSLYTPQSEMENFKRQVSDQIKEATTCNINGYQECQSHLKGLLNAVREDLTKSKKEIQAKFEALIDQIERNFNFTKIDREGVLHEIRVWEKAIFIVEKKIENIYTLIERLNKRGETCPKPE